MTVTVDFTGHTDRRIRVGHELFGSAYLSVDEAESLQTDLICALDEAHDAEAEQEVQVLAALTAANQLAIDTVVATTDYDLSALAKALARGGYRIGDA